MVNTQLYIIFCFNLVLFVVKFILSHDNENDVENDADTCVQKNPIFLFFYLKSREIY